MPTLPRTKGRAGRVASFRESRMYLAAVVLRKNQYVPRNAEGLSHKVSLVQTTQHTHTNTHTHRTTMYSYSSSGHVSPLIGLRMFVASVGWAQFLFASRRHHSLWLGNERNEFTSQQLSFSFAFQRKSVPCESADISGEKHLSCTDGTTAVVVVAQPSFVDKTYVVPSPRDGVLRLPRVRMSLIG